jgi:raffinose/stachyose/melibiose transport system permease protein
MDGRWRKRAEIAFFVGPALALFVLFVVVPIVQAAHYSMYKWNGLGPLRNFVWFQNYVNALSDEVFRGAIANNFIIAGLSILIQLPLGLGIALLLNRRIRGRALLRVVVFVPYVLAEVVAGVIWLMLLQPDGVADATLRALGLGGVIQLWLGDPSVALGTVFFVLTWKYLGQAIILFLAGLQGVPDDLYEAAQIDGASWWQIQRRIAIPLLGPTMRTWAFLSIIGSLQVFDMIWILTRGGPVNATMTMAIYMITQGSKRTLYGYASAVAVILFVISLAVASLYQVFILRRDNLADPAQKKRKGATA